MRLTWFDANSWLIEAGDQRILVDPWLVGDLVFGGMDWLVRGVRKDPSNPKQSVDIEIPENIDLILLSQGLADHAHPETLASLDKTIPVVASPDGAQVAREHGFESVTEIDHGELLRLDGLEIQAFVGAPVGAFKKENGYVLTFLGGSDLEDGNPDRGLRLYYEPHGYPDAERLKDVEAVDVAITPMADINLLTIAPVIRGGSAAVEIAELLNPQVMLPTAQNGRVAYEGLISTVLNESGGSDVIRPQLKQKGFEPRIVAPSSGETVSLSLRARAQAAVTTG